MKNKVLIIAFILLANNIFAQTTGCLSGDCQDGYGTYSYPNNSGSGVDTYTGNFSGGNRHGQGTYIWLSGDKYVGEWSLGNQNGNGTHYYVDGTSQYGYWEAGSYIGKAKVTYGCISGECSNGYGTYLWESGEKYEGYWSNNTRNGQGTNNYVDGNVYVGNWLNDQQHGYGTTSYADGEKYTGYYSYHKRKGQGTYIWKNGDKYIGEWDNDMKNGHGTSYYIDGSVESGFWKNGIYEEEEDEVYTSTGCVSGNCDNNYGVYVWEDGDRYEGYWNENKFNGEGTFYFSSGEVYNGGWKNHQRHGFGTDNYSNGNKYTGNFMFGKLDGQGTYTYESGQKYVGSFKNDHFEGEGTMYYEDGNVKSGIWKDSKYVGKSLDNYGCVSGNCTSGYGTYIYKSGSKYIGNWQEGTLNGEGSFFYAEGDKYIGEFYSGKRSGQGTYTFSVDGRKYVGQWKNNQYNGIGTMYYANETSKSGIWKDDVYVGENQITGKPPVVTWLMPEYYNSSSSSDNTTIKLCVDSKSDLKNSKIFVNNVLQVDQATRGFNVVSTACDQTIERSIKLSNGENKIKVVVENANGTTTSDVRTIKYEGNVKQKRLALIIGNSSYAKAPLRNPEKDAVAMAVELRKLGFEVMVYTNSSQVEMKKSIREFGNKLAESGATGLFYYAGHGVQMNGDNYLIPVDADIQKAPDVELEAVNLKRILNEMGFARNDLNIVILDACRDNPFVSDSRSSGGNGLATTNAPRGTFIAYATAPGSIAADGTGSNGLYTEELLKALRVEGLKIEEVFKKVRNNVYLRSNKKQVPWENSSIFDDFYFK